MDGEWKTIRLEKELNFKNGKTSPDRSSNGIYNVFGSNGVIGQANSVNADEGTIIIGRVGSYCGSTQYSAKKCWVTDNAIACITPSLKQSKYWYYLLSSLNLNDYRTGSGQPLLNQSILNSIEVRVPESGERESIAEVLSALDDKIELNRKMNETLEGIARALFKSWFVDFDPVRAKAEGRQPQGLAQEIAALFPDGFEESELGEIPKGWEVWELGSFCDIIDCLHTKKPEYQNEGKPLLQLNNIKDNGLLDMSKIFWISNEEYEKWISRIEASQGDCVITNVGRVGAVAQIPPNLKAALGRNMTGIRIKNDYPYPTFLIQYFFSDTYHSEMYLNIDTGTILEALNVKNIPKLRAILPPSATLIEFEKIVRPIRAKMEALLEENQNLSKIRDTLLPRLMCGEIRIREAEVLVEAAV